MPKPGNKEAAFGQLVPSIKTKQTQTEEGVLYRAIKHLINTCEIVDCRFGWIQSENCTFFCRIFSSDGGDDHLERQAEIVPVPRTTPGENMKLMAWYWGFAALVLSPGVPQGWF